MLENMSGTGSVWDADTDLQTQLKTATREFRSQQGGV